MHDVNDMAVEAYNRGDWAAAIRHLRTALDLQPGDPTLLANLRAVEGRAEAERVKTKQATEKRALAQAQAALQDAEAKKIRSAETAARESQRVFDQGVPLPPVTSASVVDARTPASRVQIPPVLANHSFILRMQAERAALAKDVQGLEQKLQGIREQRARGEGNRGQLEVQEVATRQEITNATHQIGFVEQKMEAFVINLTRASESASAAPPR